MKYLIFRTDKFNDQLTDIIMYIATNYSNTIALDILEHYPYMDNQINYLLHFLRTPYGRIAVEWRRKDGLLEVVLNVPEGAHAHIRLAGQVRTVSGGEHRLTLRS